MEQLVTKEDLRQFRLLLLNDFEKMLSGKPQNAEQKDEEDFEWMRSKTIRRILNISPGTLQNLRITGKVRYKKLIGSYYYSRTDVMNLFNE